MTCCTKRIKRKSEGTINRKTVGAGKSPVQRGAKYVREAIPENGRKPILGPRTGAKGRLSRREAACRGKTGKRLNEAGTAKKARPSGKDDIP